MSIERSYHEAADRAFQESWKLVNLRDGWRSAKVSQCHCKLVNYYNPRHIVFFQIKSRLTGIIQVAIRCLFNILGVIVI